MKVIKSKKQINFETIEKLILQFGSDYDLGEEVRKLYWEIKTNI